MIIGNELQNLHRWVGFLDIISTGVIRVDEETRDGTLIMSSSMPSDDGEFYLHGWTVGKTGALIASICLLEIRGGGEEILRSFWYNNNGGWVDSEEPECLSKLILMNEETLLDGENDVVFSLRLDEMDGHLNSNDAG